MELWEFNLYIEVHANISLQEQNNQTALAYKTAVFTNQALAGKLRKLSQYTVKASEVKSSPKISMEEFDRRQKHAMEMRDRLVAEKTQR